MEGTTTPIGDPALTTGEAAQLLGSSRQHIVDLCVQGALPYESVGRHRRVRRSSLLAFKRHQKTGGLTRDQLRSLWLHRAVAAKLLTNPRRALTLARRNLRKLHEAHPRGRVTELLREWGNLLDGPIEAIADVLTSKDQHSVEMRQNSPFAGVLTDRERTAVLKSFRHESVFP